MGKAYCTRCKKTLNQVLSSFECLATWNKAEGYYEPEDSCNLLKRCPACGNLTKERTKKITRKMIGKEDFKVHHSGNKFRDFGRPTRQRTKG